MVNCRECKNQVSPNAKSCPHCGAPYPSRAEWKGTGFEWKSEATYLGYPLVHVAFGRNERGRLRVAKGVIAIGQFAIGAITFAQFGIGFLFGFGQFILGLTAIAQFAVGPYFAIGQFAAGHIAIGQFVVAHYGLAQAGFAQYLWSPERRDEQAVVFFQNLGRKVGVLKGG